MTRLRSLLCLLLPGSILVASVVGATPRLQVAVHATGFDFELTGASGTNPWVLQHSQDGKKWEDLAFFIADAAGGIELELPLGALLTPSAPRGFFRARQLDEDNDLLRQLVSERTKWRLSGPDRYEYQLRQNFSWIFWRGIIEVETAEVKSFATLEFFSPFPEPPEIPGIEGLFDRIARAIAGGAEQIDVTWDRALGYPVNCAIDDSAAIADDESGWTIESFTPASPGE